jgi:formate-dependent nitrite reductase membrane component NrfD
MPDAPESDKLIEKVIQDAETAIRKLDPSPFSPNAYSVLRSKIAEHIAELIRESIKVSKRHQSDTVSAAHVERASEYLVSSSARRLFRHVGTLGGIFLGAGISTMLTMTVAGQYSSLGVLLSAGLGIVGAFMIALHIAKD